MYAASGAGLISGNGTPTLKVQLGYHQNPSDNIDFGDLVVTADTGLAITGVSITDQLDQNDSNIKNPPQKQATISVGDFLTHLTS